MALNIKASEFSAFYQVNKRMLCDSFFTPCVTLDTVSKTAFPAGRISGRTHSKISFDRGRPGGDSP
jgi:hypothetical protein